MPSWIPLCRAMQRYCEPYFTALEAWRTHTDPEIIANRLLALEIGARLMAENALSADTQLFQLEHAPCELLAPVLPSVGLEFIPDGDRAAFAAAKSLVPEFLFNKGGLFFQNNFLKPVSGFTEDFLASVNAETRQSLVDGFDLLLRLPESAGRVKWVAKPAHTDSEVTVTQEVPSNGLSDPGKAFLAVIIEAKKYSLEDNPAPVPVPARVPVEAAEDAKTSTKGKGKAAKTTKAAKEPATGKAPKAAKAGKKAKEDEPVWTNTHPSYGMEVAAYFGKKLFRGKVDAYCPPSAVEEADQLYRVLWEDGDREDYDEAQLEAGSQLFAQHYATASSAAATAAVSPAKASTPAKAPAATRQQQQAVKKPAAAETARATPSKQRKEVVQESSEESEEEEIQWVKQHDCVGTAVAAYFGSGKRKRLFHGTVVMYAPPSAEGAGDQLYRIRWEDGDSEDYDEEQLTAGKELLAKHLAEGNGSSSKKRDRTSATAEKRAAASPSPKKRRAASAPSSAAQEEDEEEEKVADIVQELTTTPSVVRSQEEEEGDGVADPLDMEDQA